MIDSSTILNASNKLKEGQLIAVNYKNLKQILCDSRNEEAVTNLLSLVSNKSIGNPKVLLNSDRMVNQCVKDMPEVAWDMMDYATTPLTIELDGGQFAAKQLITSDNCISIQKSTEGLLFNLLSKFNRPIACIQMDNTATFPQLYQIKNTKQNWTEKILKIRINGEVEIISS
jgi:L-threonylcarbamoyladenylate synthase